LTFMMIAKDLALRVLGGIAVASDRKARARPLKAGEVQGLGVVHSGNWGRGFGGRGKDGSSKRAVGTFTSWARIVRPVAHIAKVDTPHH
jgi:hypothetical protein